ncbi:MAG: ornithine aminomutase subunit alpha [Firmicutes bacterium]|jgi:D-ornithine 4,5-aminomutase subunit alpha|nr:ornithine aminomutase subunit alpha [Bacillota bacterium]
MKKTFVREDDYLERRKELKSLSDEEIFNKFWSLAEELVSPMYEMAKTHTTPSIERSVLLRMGFSSLEVKPLVEAAIDRNLIAFGVGHLVYRVSRDKQIPIRDAGLEMLDGKHWDYLEEVFRRD